MSDFGIAVSKPDQNVFNMQANDLIFSSDVLEHTLEPERVIKHLIEHMNNGGWMWLSVFMDDMQGEDPSHLRNNTERYNNPNTWHSIVESLGLKPMLYSYTSGVLKGWYKP